MNKLELCANQIAENISKIAYDRIYDYNIKKYITDKDFKRITEYKKDPVLLDICGENRHKSASFIVSSKTEMSTEELIYECYHDDGKFNNKISRIFENDLIGALRGLAFNNFKIDYASLPLEHPFISIRDKKDLVRVSFGHMLGESTNSLFVSCLLAWKPFDVIEKTS